MSISHVAALLYRSPFLQRIGRSSVSLLTARIVTQLQLALFTVLAARRLTETGFGQYAFIASAISLGNVITTFGTDTLLIREVARTRTTDTPIVPTSFWLQITLSALFIGLTFLGAGWLPNKTSETILGLKVYSLSLVPLAFFSVYSALLRAYERMDLYLATSLVSAVLLVGGAWLVLDGSGRLRSLVFLLLLIQVCAAVLAGALCYRHIPGMTVHWRVTRANLAQVLRAAWRLALLSILAILYQRLGTLMLSLLGSDALTGWFSASARIVDALKIAHFAVLGALLPALSNLGHAAEGEREARVLFRRSVFLLLAFAVIASVGMAFLARPLVMFLYGASYAPSVAAVQILALSLIPYTVTASLSLRLVVEGHERRVLQVTVVGLMASLLFNAWFIPSLGLMGACVAAAASECLQAAAFLVLERKR